MELRVCSCLVHVILASPEENETEQDPSLPLSSRLFMIARKYEYEMNDEERDSSGNSTTEANEEEYPERTQKRKKNAITGEEKEAEEGKREEEQEGSGTSTIRLLGNYEVLE